MTRYQVELVFCLILATTQASAQSPIADSALPQTVTRLFAAIDSVDLSTVVGLLDSTSVRSWAAWIYRVNHTSGPRAQDLRAQLDLCTADAVRQTSPESLNVRYVRADWTPERSRLERQALAAHDTVRPVPNRRGRTRVLLGIVEESRDRVHVVYVALRKRHSNPDATELISARREATGWRFFINYDLLHLGDLDVALDLGRRAHTSVCQGSR
jgi:hypothetical protein